jgi:Transglycosylase SLT domain
VTGPDVRPDLRVSDPKQFRQTLGGLMRGISGPENPPLGVLPDGSLVRDLSYLAKKPSIISPQREQGFIFGDKVTPEFLTKVKQISSNLGIDPNWLMAVMDFESGLSPTTRNAKSGATGLIQFTKAAGYDPTKLAGMTAEDQLDKVADYLKNHKGKLGNLSDLYMSVLWPGAIGKPDDYVLFKSPSREYKQNSELDVAGKGYVTKSDAAAAVERRYQAGLKRGTTTLRADGSSESRVGTKTIVQLPRRSSVITGPEVKPDLRVSDPKQVRTTLDRLMR